MAHPVPTSSQQASTGRDLAAANPLEGQLHAHLLAVLHATFPAYRKPARKIVTTLQDEVLRAAIIWALTSHKGNTLAAARSLDINRNTLRMNARRLGIDRASFREPAHRAFQRGAERNSAET